MLSALDIPDDKLDDSERTVVAMIREHGWFHHHILGEDSLPSFDYTTGFQVTLGVPEIIIFGMSNEAAHGILWNVFNAVKEGLLLDTGTAYSDFSNLPDRFQPVAKAQYPEHLGWSRWFYGGDNFDCWQMVWTDREGRFPWDAEFDPTMTKFQPDLSDCGWNGMVLAEG